MAIKLKLVESNKHSENNPCKGCYFDVIINGYTGCGLDTHFPNISCDDYFPKIYIWKKSK